MKTKSSIFLLIAFAALAMAISSCSNQKNTAGSRWWQAFNTRYNVYFNGAQAYIEGSLAKENGNKDNYTEIIPLYTVGNKNSRELGKGSYETAITKAEKAIKLHSIKKKPEWTKSRKKTERDLEWLNRREYNPFIWKAWMLMGRSQFQSGKFDEAAATFSYMGRLFRTQPAIYGKARAWLAKCYIEQDWLYDAEDVIRNMSRDSIDWRAQKEWDYTYADYYTHIQDWPNAEKYLRRVVKHEKRAKQRAREYFLLGQVLALQNKSLEAYRAFKKVISQNPPYELEFNARIAMCEVLPEGHSKQKISKLKAMARSDKNAEYLDQVYYALGNVYLADKDTLKAIGAYEMGSKKATRSGIEKGVLLLNLGNLYWQLERYSDAKRCYGEAIGLLDKERPDYAELSTRSKILDELCPFTDAVHLQDSLQALAHMSEKDRNEAIDRVIEALKKKEKEERKQKAIEEAENQRQQNGGNDMANNQTTRNQPTTPNSSQSGLWYFYNTQAVQQGKQAFQQQWGNRKNEDHWQRINKTVVATSENSEEQQYDADGNPISPDSIASPEMAQDSVKTDTAALDPHKREYYLAQIPFTDEQMEASNKILSDGLFNSGVIFKDKLDNLPLSDKALSRLITEFPDFEKSDEALYHLFLLRNRQLLPIEADEYKNQMKERFPESQWTTIVTDPYFRENALYGTHIEDSLYADTYEAFRTDQHSVISRNSQISEKRFPLGQHRDKFIFIGGLSRLNQGDADSCVNAMKRVVNEYPQSEVAGIAGMIVKGVSAGRHMRGTKFDISSLWDKRTVDLNDEKRDSTIQLSPERNTEFLFVMSYDPDSINLIPVQAGIETTAENQLLYEMARHNFTNYLVRNFDLVIEEYEGLHRLVVSGFNNYDEAYQYTRQLFQKDQIARIASMARNIIISQQNFQLLGSQFSYNDYDEFYQKHFAPLNITHRNLFNDPQIAPELYDPELQESTKKDVDTEQDDDNTITPSSSTEIEIAPEPEQPQSSTDVEIKEDTPEQPQSSTTVEIKEDTPEQPQSSTAVEIKEDTPEQPQSSTTVEIKEDTPEQPQSSTTVEIKEDTPEEPSNTTIRQQINSEIIEIIDEEDKTSSTPTQDDQKDDDEYFDLDGF